MKNKYNLFTIKSFLMYLATLIFLFCLSWAFLSAISHLNVCYYQHRYTFGSFFQNVVLVLLALLFIGFLFILYQFLKKKNLSAKKLWKIALFFLALFLLLQVISFQLIVEPSWDFGSLFIGAISFWDKVELPFIWEYLSKFPNNIAMYILELFLIGVGHNIMSPLKIMVFVNAAMIFLGILMLFFYLKKNHSLELAIIGLIFCLFLSPLYLYTPIFYTDTFTMWIPIFLLFCYSFVKKKEITKKNFVFIFLIGLGSIWGMQLKMSVFIMTIAIFIDVFLNHSWKYLGQFFAIFGVSFLIGYGAFQLCYQKVDHYYQFNDDLKIPYNHWINMGMHHLGGYFHGDYEVYDTIKGPEVRYQYNKEKIKERLKEYGMFGYIGFLHNKIAYTFGDGTYFVSDKLSRQPYYQNTLGKFVRNQETYFSYYELASRVIHYGLLLLMILSAILSLKMRNWSSLPSFLAITGLFLFLLIWETRSRYLYNYIPIFLVSALPVLEKVKMLYDQKRMK